MINEELKTFINKMRAAGKTDPEITAELKVAGWEEGKVNQHLLPKTNKIMLGLRKMKFWIWLYGIAILLFLISLLVGFLFGSTFPGETAALIILIFFMSYAFGIVPLVTLFAIGFKLLFWILKRSPRFKNWSSGRRINYWWMFIIPSFIGGAIMLPFGIIEARQPNIGLGGVAVGGSIALLGLTWIILTLILALALIIVKIISKRKKRISNRL